VVVVAVAVAWPLGAQAQNGARAGDEPLEAAARAAEQVPFSGVLLVQWTDGPTPKEERLHVEGANGSVVVHGATNVMAEATRRLVAHGSGDWNLLWLGSNGASRPPTQRKYEVVEVPAATVADRPARVIEARENGTLVERLFLDQATSLLLRREHYERGTNPDRTVAFESVTIGGSATPVPAPAEVVDQAPRVVSQAQPSGVSAPLALADGYVRVGLYRKSSVVQAQYSDGLFDMSVFEQEGRLDPDSLPDGERVPIGRAKAWHYEWAGGHIMVWQRSGTVYTAVSDAPLDDVITAMASLPAVNTGLSFVNRLRQVCRSLVQPFAD
jgi:sigma-E factor negative regulatory protein RseB